MANVIYTVGYSGYHQDVPRFIADLRNHRIDVVVDVRTSPYSKFSPEYNRENIASALKDARIKYVFMGDELGARPRDPGCYTNGAVDYDKITVAQSFVRGLNRVREGFSKGFVIALLCAEKDPVDCHRNVLVAHALSKQGVAVRHLIQLAKGEPAVVENQEDTESRLFEECDQGDSHQGDLFLSKEDLLERVYKIRFSRIAYREIDDAEE